MQLHLQKRLLKMLLAGITLVCGTGCGTVATWNQKKVLLKVSARCAVSQETLPRRVYLFPPLKIDQKGQPIEEYIPVINRLGQLDWEADAPESTAFRKELLAAFDANQFEAVPFTAVSDSQKAVLLVSSYYSEPWREPSVELRRSSRKLLFVRLTGFVVPPSMDHAKRRDFFNQEVLIRFDAAEKMEAAIATAFRYAVRTVGLNVFQIEKDRLP